MRQGIEVSELNSVLCHCRLYKWSELRHGLNSINFHKAICDNFIMAIHYDFDAL